MKRFDHINVIPFIDIMLVLLAIVLTTATFVSQGKLKIDVPKTSSKNTSSQNHQSIQIAINKNNQLFYKQQEVTLKDLEQSIALLDVQQKIALSVHYSIPFQQFVNVLDVLKKYKFEQLSIITKQDQ